MGNPSGGLVHTPHLDNLAHAGTQFNQAYTPCPICIPARASIATGRYVYEHGNWDNAHPYTGKHPSWHHVLRDRGIPCDVIGKLHFNAGEDHGFRQEITPLHVHGDGDLLACLRSRQPARPRKQQVLDAGPGNSTYLDYDQSITEQAAQWLQNAPEDPWVLMVSFVCPHPPYIAPQEWWDYYEGKDLPLPIGWDDDVNTQHPFIRRLKTQNGYHPPFTEAEIRRQNQAYAACCSFLDNNIGRLLLTLEDAGLMDNTNVIYTSDHGENRGSRGIFGKFTMYDESARVPLLAMGPDFNKGMSCHYPVSLVDLHPTILEVMRVEDESPNPNARSLQATLSQCGKERWVLSEYHAIFSHHGVFMVTNGKYKFIEHIEGIPELYDLEVDPLETHNLADSPAHFQVNEKARDALHRFCNPVEVDRAARATQQSLIEFHGGDEAVRSRGYFNNSPIPGETPAMHPIP